jgi:hypothetical protein
MPDFRLQTIGCESVIVWHLTSYFSRLPNIFMTNDFQPEFRYFISGSAKLEGVQKA